MSAAEHLGPTGPQFTLWPSKTETKGRRVTAGSWAEWFASPTFAEPPRDVVSKAGLQGWAPTTFAGDRRSKANVEAVYALVLDYEPREGVEQGTPLADILDLWGGYRGLVHSTYSHEPDAPCYRVVLPLSRPVSRQEYERLSAWAIRLGLEAGHAIDTKPSDASRLWFVPAVRPGAAYERQELPGLGWLDVDGTLDGLPSSDPAPAPPASAQAPRSAPAPAGASNVERYVRRTLERAVDGLRTCPPGSRNNLLAKEAFGVGGLLHLAVVGEREAEAELLAATRGWPEPERSAGTVRRQLRAGAARPRSVPELRVVGPEAGNDTWSLPPQGAAGGGGGSSGAAPAAPGRKGAAPTGEDKGRKLVRLLVGLEYFRSPTGRLFLAHQGEAVACDSTRYSEVISGLFWAAYEGVLSASAIDDATRVRAASVTVVRPAAVRVQGDARRLLVDLGSGTYQVTADGDEVGPADEPTPWFRPAGSAPLPAPAMAATDEESAAVLAELRQLLDLDDQAWAACLAWMFACLRPVGPYPLLLLRGEKGSGKSTLARALRRLVDPRKPELKTLPGKGPEAIRLLAISAEHAHVLAFDNLSTLDADLSDALCRIATGDGFEARKMYKGRDLDVFEASRPVLLTSITDAATRADLLDRSLLVRLPPRQRRLDDDQLEAALGALAPRVLGALLYAAHRALGALEQTDVPGAIRMRAPARWAAAGEAALGLPPGAVVAAYLASREESESFDTEDPFLTELLDYLEEKSGPAGCRLTMTAGKLLEALTSHAFPQGKPPTSWPGGPRAVRARLDRSAAALRAQGVALGYGKEGHKKDRVITLERTVGQPSAAAETDRPQGRPGNEAAADGADGADGGSSE